MIQNNINCFCLQILVLLITGLVTIIQMQEHPIMLQLEENLQIFMKNITNKNDTI